MKTNQAELTTRLVVFLSGRPEDLERFFAISGVDPTELRERIGDTAFQDGLLDYMLANEPLLLAFCEEFGEDPSSLMRIAQARNSGHEDWS
ncbi:MAG: DUF3572 family protein [Devosiaceae bacterium]